ncbi:MAG TPA: sigma-70 family RNA polymerase sigma factor [Gammaproteobacteria bacterium]|nr:sigma-70 family RNA polymerase sigma factor [Gammaproteobacteria bacterium]
MQRDDAALSRFLQSVRGAALAFSVLRVRDEEIALDLLQEAMISFVPAAKKHDQQIWKRLFYKILGRRIADWQRKQIWRDRIARITSFSALPLTDGEEQIDPPAGNDERPEQSLDAAQLAERFEAVLAALPPRQQEAYLLRQWQAFSVTETAAIMGCSEGSVKTHLSRAMQRLEEQLGEWIDE